MEFIDLSKNWKYTRGLITGDIALEPNLEDVNLPVDLLCGEKRNFGVAMGEQNGYYDTACATFYKELPQIQDYEQIFLEIDGLGGFADIFVNGIFVDSSCSYSPNIIDITKYYYNGIKNVLKMSITASTLAGKYTGLGVGGGVKIIVRRSNVAICPYGVQVVTAQISDKATLNIDVNINNIFAQKQPITLEISLYNARGKRVSHKIKRMKLGANSDKIYQNTLRLSNFYVYSPQDPYLYLAKVNIYSGGELLDEATTTFGVQNVTLSNKGLALNGKVCKLKGAVMSHDNGILGMTSFAEAELFKLTRIKNIGYNAVRYIGCPTDECLNCLDRLGLYALIDIFDVWQEGKYPQDGHADFAQNWQNELQTSVLKLRNHPSVVMYSIGNNIPESYNRGGGAALATEIADTLRWYDNSRVITANATELAPLRQELESAGVKLSKADGDYSVWAMNAAKEKDLFFKQTLDFFKAVDVAGYSYLHSRFSGDKAITDRMIVGLASYPERAYEALDEAEKNINVIGDFKAYGADYLGGAKKPCCNNQTDLACSCDGDLSITYNAKPQAEYRKILMGDRTVSLIAVLDPELQQGQGSGSVVNAVSSWNFSSRVGQKVEIQVYSGGEVVALYLDGKLIGRKLAGKVNKHIAIFKTEYYPGKLEAVSYHKGVECSRATLQTVSAAKVVRLFPTQRVIKVGGVSFIEISLWDSEGRLVECANQTVKVAITGDGNLIALGSGDPKGEQGDSFGECALYNGKALMAVRATGEGKIGVQVFSEGLRNVKIAIKVKPAL